MDSTPDRSKLTKFQEFCPGTLSQNVPFSKYAKLVHLVDPSGEKLLCRLKQINLSRRKNTLSCAAEETRYGLVKGAENILLIHIIAVEEKV